jgi:hypothetical protein
MTDTNNMPDPLTEVELELRFWRRRWFWLRRRRTYLLGLRHNKHGHHGRARGCQLHKRRYVGLVTT